MLIAGVVAAAAQLWLVAVAGTDVPFMDQWDEEGRMLYPRWVAGELGLGDLLAAHNEHRIAWTRLWNLALFELNGGRWDPLLQLAANAVLKGALAAALVWMLARAAGAKWHAWTTFGVVVAATMPAAWHNALWGFQSAVYISLIFSVASLAWLGRENPTVRERVAGLAAGDAALLAMGAGAITPLALLALEVFRLMERRGAGGWRVFARRAWPALALLGLAVVARGMGANGTQELMAREPGVLAEAMGRAWAWPHTAMPIAAFALNAPAVIVVSLRMARRAEASATTDAFLGLWFWGMAAAAAMAWTRGASDEWAFGVPSRYADFLVLLPLANAGCAAWLAKRAVAKGERAAVMGLAAWALFLAVGWAGLSAEAWRRVIRPRLADREAPVRLARAFMDSGGDGDVFKGQPRLLTPHPAPEVVWAVVNDPRLAGCLPPTFQAGCALGPGSMAVRWLLGREAAAPVIPHRGASGER
jgi:hypothetical protein